MVPRFPPQPGARWNNILERIRIFETLNQTENEITYRSEEAGGHTAIKLLKEEKENLNVVCETPRKRKADETPELINSEKKHKGSKIEEYISQLNQNSNSITPTAPALPVSKYTHILEEQTDADHPQNILPLRPVLRGLSTRGMM